ncbi:hypothetical protein [Aquimarina longa]|uniref:hypothetical protein n=1 Tax=Aquimarina longa TaxID=1080221 RepID=UPI0007833ED4|nr:hypothetical protein [Aquimarina longa]
MKLKKNPLGDVYLEINKGSDLVFVKDEYKDSKYTIRLNGDFSTNELELFVKEFANVKELRFCNGLEGENEFLYSLESLENLILRFYSDVPTVVDFSKIAPLKFLGFGYQKKYLKNICYQKSLQKLSVSDYTEKDMTALSCLTSIKEFRTIAGKMKSLEGIQHLTNLEKLEISAHRSLTDISQIAALQNLKYLEINTCWKMADFSPIGKLKNLKQLEIIDCKNLESIKFVSDMPNLKSLNTLGTTIINDYDTTPAEHVPVFFGSQHNKYNKQYPEKEIHKKIEEL